MSSRLTVDVAVESWPLAEPFRISRGVKTEAHVVVASISDGTHVGRGEAVPYARYGETVDAVVATIAATSPTDRQHLATLLPAGAARNALDCALWDLDAKRAGLAAWQLASLPTPGPRATAFTLSLDTPAAMAAKAASLPHLPLLKLKLAGDGDDERMRAVRQARPDARLIADANEAWTADQLAPFLSVAAAMGFEVVEQPLPADSDAPLADLDHPVPVCADESAHTTEGLAALRGRYDAINIKLDKTGGLTEALRLRVAARASGLKIMVGSMVATSLSMAPAMLVAQDADWIDLDSPLLLARDRPHGLTIGDGIIHPPLSALWG